ncbi:Cell division protein FtsW [Clostridiaceae bacterium JG1575]|nr:Cell division protein FtsW [Clostridiaceae bacterium JG1575]
MEPKRKSIALPIYLLTAALFLNITLASRPLDPGALIIGLSMIILIAYVHFLVRRFFSYGDPYLVSLVSILPVVGIALIYRINSALAFRQVIWFILGIFVFSVVVILLPDLQRFAKLRYLYLVLTLAFVSMAMLIGTEVYGAKNWVFIGGFSFQPSEFGKIFYVLYLASALRTYKDLKSLLEPAAVVAVCLGFMVLQKDLGSALIFTFVALAMLFVATHKLKYILASFGVGSLGAVVSYKLFRHVRIRVLMWRNPFSDRNGDGYQIVQGLYAIASGGLFGRGLFQGSPQSIPVRESDYIFAVMAEELGLLFCLGILLVYLLIFYRSIRVSLNVESLFSSLLTVGFSIMIAMQVLVIVGGVMNAIPLTGITLPLISYGGTSMLTVFFALGIIQKTSEEVQ